MIYVKSLDSNYSVTAIAAAKYKEKSFKKAFAEGF